MNDDVNQIDRTPVENVLPDTPVEFSSISYKKGDVIFAEGEESFYLYIIAKGAVKILVNADSKLIPVSIVNEKDFIGELSLFTDEKRTASAIALENTQLIAFKKSTLRKIIKECPEWVINIMLTITDRLKHTTSVLMEHGISNLDKGKHYLSDEEMAYYIKILKEYKHRKQIN